MYDQIDPCNDNIVLLLFLKTGDSNVYPNQIVNIQRLQAY